MFELANKVALISFLLFFTAIAVFGPALSMVGGHTMPGCPFMHGQQAICPMNTVTHIADWQRTIAAVIPLLILAATFLFFFSFLLPQAWSSPPGYFRGSFIGERITPLALASAFSRGILHAKLYA